MTGADVNFDHRSYHCATLIAHNSSWALFLAHLRGAYAITLDPSSLFVSTAHFVSAGAIDPKLCTYVLLGMSNQFSVQSDSWLGHHVAKTKNTKSAISLELMAESSPNFYHRYICVSSNDT
jgi:hypothetical protein